MTQNTRNAVIYSLFFVSGATSLILELLWLRGFAILFGSTLYAMSCVLTAFTLGLALGSHLSERWLRRVERTGPRGPAYFVISYGVLELVVGVSGLLLTLALFRAQGVLLEGLAGAGSGSLVGTLAIQFSLSFLLMAIPTMCMGATLPILCMGLRRDSDTSSLYSFNTFGAAVGSLAASFVLIYQLGCIASAVFVACLSAVLWLVALVTARHMPGREVDEVESGQPRSATQAGGDSRPREVWSPASFLGLAFFSGYVFFSYELVWNRMLGLILGNRVYVTSVTLFLVLLCIGIGARSSPVLARRYSPRSLLLGCYSIAILSALSASWAHVSVLQTPTGAPATLAFVVALICVPASAMGVVLPLLLSLPAAGATRGVHVARLYAANLVGSVLGSLLTGYVLVEALGSGRLLLLNAGLLLLALGVFARPSAGWGRPRRVAVAALVACYAATFVLRWAAPVSVIPPDNRLVLEEDEHGIFSIEKLNGGFLSVRNNATELVFHYGRRMTQYVQESEAHFPMLVAQRHRRVAVIGSGYGITAGAFGRYPVERIDAVEILPLIVEYAAYFEEGTHRYRENPKIRVHVADGRHFLANSRERYDIISVNVSDPYLPGSSSLFSREFYELVKQKLEPGGVVCQHIFGPDIASLYHGFKAHFKYVRAIPAYRNGISVLGSDDPILLRNLDLLEDVSLPGRPKPDAHAVDYVRRVLTAGDRFVAELDAREPEFLNSDDFPHLEFRRSNRIPLFFSNQ
jgi:spermidine synthase